MKSKATANRVVSYKQMKASRDVFLKQFYNLNDSGNNICTKDHLAVLLAEMITIKATLAEILKINRKNK